METPQPKIGAGQQYNLKWTNHTNNMLQVFQQHLVKESFVDVTLSCEGCFIKAHKIVLSACSSYFEQLFSYHTVQHPLIIMNGIKFNDLKQVIEFMYRGEIKVAETDLDSLLSLAESLQVKGLSNVRNKNIPKPDQKQRENKQPDPPVAAENNQRKRRRSSVSPQVNNEDNTINGGEAVLNENEEESGLNFRNIMDHQGGEMVLAGKSDSKKTKKPKEDNDGSTGSKIPRPPNAFMIFANEWRRKIATEHPNESNKDISVRLGTLWKSLSTEVKSQYYSASKKADEEHKVKYPGYYYSPKEARERKAITGTKKGVKFYDASNLVKLNMSPDLSETEDSSKNNSDIEEVEALETPGAAVIESESVDDPNPEEI